MSSLACYASGITGYSACWNNRVVTIHAHTIADGMSFIWPVASLDNFVWLYMPLDVDEKMEELWKLQHKKQATLIVCISSFDSTDRISDNSQFKTDKGRVWMLGPRPMSGTRWTLTLIDQRRPGTNRIYFESSPLGVHKLAFESPQPVERQPLIVPAPTSWHPKTAAGQGYFHSSAELSSVEEVTPCRHIVDGQVIVTGLLLRYSTGRQACVGQVRLDWLGRPLQVDMCQTLWLGFSLEKGGMCVTALGLSRPESQKPMTFLDVPFRGSIDWWFSRMQCQVFYQNRASPPPKT